MNILTDNNGCMDSIDSGDMFKYYSNDSKACPLVQVLGSSQGLIEDFKDGSFRLRPDNDMLTDLKNNYYKKSVFTGCANGNSAEYNLYFYRQKCSQL